MPRELILSLFSGIGLLDRPFTELGHCVCATPDLITGGNLRDFNPIPRRFNGVIAGPPCQGFSNANRHRTKADHASVKNSLEMLTLTMSILDVIRPEWFLIENVPNVPDVRLSGYTVQRCYLTDQECGGRQLRPRVFQFGSFDGLIIRPKRVNDQTRNQRKGRKPIAVTTKTRKHQFFPDVCERQGLPRTFKLPGWCQQAKVKAVGNGVPLTMGRTIANAVNLRSPPQPLTDCQCGCGRTIEQKTATRRLTATATCRKRKQLRKNPQPYVDQHGYHKP